MYYSRIRLAAAIRFTVGAFAVIVAAAPAMARMFVSESAQTSELEIRNNYVSLMERLKDNAIERDKIMKEFYEDFERIQTINMELSKAFQSSDAPNYNWVSRESAEVKKHATRLKHNLMLPPSSKPEERREETNEGSGKDQVRAYVRTLNLLTMGFVSSPLFQKDVKIDYQDVGKARRNLDGIIEFSDKAKKSADLLSKGKAN